MLSMMPSVQPAAHMKASTTATMTRMQNVLASVMMMLRLAASKSRNARQTLTLAHRIAVSTSTDSVRMIMNQNEDKITSPPAGAAAFCVSRNSLISSYSGSKREAGVKGLIGVSTMSLTNLTTSPSSDSKKPSCWPYGFANGGPCSLNHSSTSAAAFPVLSASSGNVRPRSATSHALKGRMKQPETPDTMVSGSPDSSASHMSRICCCIAGLVMSQSAFQTTAPRSLGSAGSLLSLSMPLIPNKTSNCTLVGSTLPPLPSFTARDGRSKSPRSNTDRQNGWSGGKNCAGSSLVSICVAAIVQSTMNTKKNPRIG
mmetsp:Transcript_89154/g.216256  ORF Transcript_89154/g.216256 Transcript_89154/m.216256 type:complete len:314 (+) Transcript_89154:748-1689(+)